MQKKRIDYKIKLELTLFILGSLLVLFFVAFSITGNQVNQSSYCSDSDDGQVIDVQGDTSDGSRTITDYCDADEVKLYEHSCGEDGKILTSKINCGTIGMTCVEGACVASEDVQFHSSCSNDRCVFEEGPGEFVCFEDVECIGTDSSYQEAVHSECVEGMCLVVGGEGENECIEDSDCEYEQYSDNPNEQTAEENIENNSIIDESINSTPIFPNNYSSSDESEDTIVQVSEAETSFLSKLIDLFKALFRGV